MTDRYSAPARALHWLMALLLLALLALGFYMHDLPLSPDKLKLYAWHKWAGVTAFLLAALRLGWRLSHTPPPLPTTISARDRQLAAVGHGLIYVLMFAIPLSGWLMSSAKGFQTVWFGVLPIPDLLGKDPALGETLAGLHQILNLTFVILLLGHIGAALKHHFIERTPFLRRM